MFPWHMAYVMFTGALFGSFFNVCIYRIPAGVPLSLPPSHCYQCGQTVRWFDNIPLVSYWVLRGRCRHCAAPFSIRYFFIELFTMLLWGGIFLRFCNPWGDYGLGFIPGIVLGSLLLVGSFTDLDHWIIPDRISLGGTAAGIALAAVWPLGLAPHNPLSQSFVLETIYLPESVEPLLTLPRKLVPLVNAVCGAAVGYSVLWSMGWIGRIIFRKEAMGQGDVKLAAAFGAFCGPINFFAIFFVACVLGSVTGLGGIALSRLARREPPDPSVAPLEPEGERADRLIRERNLGGEEKLAVMRALSSPGTIGAVRHHLPFGPQLSVAAMTVFLAWEPMQNWFMNSFWHDIR